MKAVFEFVPEHYTGGYPVAIIRIKKSQLTPLLQSEIEEALEKFKEDKADVKLHFDNS